MKKTLSTLFAIVLIAAGFSMQSCQKCSLCSYTYTNIQGEQKTFTYSEVCGNSGDVNDYKDACAAAAAAYTDGICTCVDE